MGILSSVAEVEGKENERSILVEDTMSVRVVFLRRRGGDYAEDHGGVSPTRCSQVCRETE